MDDQQLLQEYAARNSESAFRTLVTRYVNLVHSAALRQARDQQMAEEITQAVFILLARKAGSLRQGVILSGWLFRTTRFVASRAMRSEQRRVRREQEAYEMQQITSSDEAWQRVAPALDEAMEGLSETDRNALLLRFFQDKPLREVGTALGVSEEAAKKRVTRSIEKLRTFFAERGFTVSATALSGLLSVNAVQAAPATLAASIAAKACCVTATLPLVTEVLHAWSWMKLKIAGGFLAIGTAAIVVLLQVSSGEISEKQPILSTESRRVATETLAETGISQNGGTAAQTNKNSKRQNSLRFRVVSAVNDRPIAQASIALNTVAGGEWKKNFDLKTDGDGFCFVPYPDGTGRLDVGAFATGCGARFVTWRPGNEDKIPDEFTLRLLPATNHIGGRLVDAAGKPVSGADIFVRFSAGDASARETPRERPGFLSAVPVTKSDSDGRWMCWMIPADFKDFGVEARHPDFANNYFIYVIPEEPADEFNRKKRSQLWEGNLVVKMTQGAVLKGLVLSETGEPIAGARITERTGAANGVTGADGGFTISKIADDEIELFLTVSADGYQPERRTVEITTDMEPLEFRLKKGATLRLRLVDEKEEPVPNAEVVLEQWGEHRHVLDWSASSDSDGRIEWNSAPPSAKLELCAMKGGFCYTRAIHLEADGEEHTIKMQRAHSVRVRAVNADTGEPVMEFKAYPGYGETETGWTRSDTRHSNEGVAKVLLNEWPLPWRIRIEAKGYARFTSEPLEQTKPAELEVRLEPLKAEKSPRGIVWMPNTQPAIGADVALCTFEQQTGVHLFRDGLRRGSMLEKTDAKGAFEFAPDSEAHTVVVSHSSGFARVRLTDVREPLAIALQQWGRIEGQVPTSLASKTNLQITLCDWAAGQYSGGLEIDQKSFSAPVQPDGTFVIEQVPPGQFFIGVRHLLNRPLTHHTPINIKAGETTVLQIRDDGHQVIGKLEHPDPVQIYAWEGQVTSAMLHPRDIKRMPKPNGLSKQAEREWELTFWHTDAATSRLLETQSFPIFMDKHGSFRAHNVAPGKYLMSIEVRRLAAISEESPLIGKISETIVIEPNGNSLVDLGVRRLEIPKTVSAR